VFAMPEGPRCDGSAFEFGDELFVCHSK
jgi:hypothetical protein